MYWPGVRKDKQPADTRPRSLSHIVQHHTSTGSSEAMQSDTTGEMSELPAVARLYYTGVGSRRTKHASTRNGPGEPLCFVSLAEQRIRQAVAMERAKWEDLADEYNRLIQHMDAGG